MILITGASGFIAGHVIERLCLKEKIRAVDLREKKFASKNVEFAKADVRDLGGMEKASAGCEGVIHLAAQIDVGKSVSDPIFDFGVNALGTLNCLMAAKKNNAGRFIYSSSAAVYGHPKRVPVSEEDEPSPISPYGSSKLAGERHVIDYARVHGLGAVALRIFNVYGKGQGNNEYSGVITKFKERIGEGKPPVIYGDGKQVRDFVHVTDVADAICKAYYSSASGEAVNIGSGKGASILELADSMIRLSGKNLKPEFMPEREGDIKESVADVKKAERILSWKAKVRLEDGLKGI